MGRRVRFGLLASVCALLAACSESGSGGDPAGSTSGTGGTGAAGGSGSSSVPPPPGKATCGADCVTDREAARAALEAGDYAAAFALYRCADTPESAFGAGLTRLLTSVEGAAATRLMTDLGLAPLVATDFVGTDGILARLNRRWDGAGSLTVSGAIDASLSFDRAQQALGEYPDFRAGDYATDAVAALSVELDGSSALAAGTALPLSYDCTLTLPTRRVDPRLSWLTLQFEVDGDRQFCELPYAFEGAPCEPDGGRIVITEGTATVGARVTYSLENLLLTCRCETDELAPNPLGDLVRVTGTASAIVVPEEVDVTGLHPMLAEDFDLRSTLPPTTTVSTVIADAAGLGPELEEAACFFRRASAGTGTLFSFPGTLVGGGDIDFSQGDTQVLGAALLFLAAAAELGTAATIPIPLTDLVCDSDVACPTEAELVDRFNTTFATSFDPTAFAETKRLIGEALPLLDAGLANLDESSLLVKNATSSAGMVMIRDLVQAAIRSLAGESIAIPHVSPEITVNLGSFFDSARNPREIQGPVLSLTEECDDFDCWSYTEISTDYLQAYCDGSIDVDWDGSYEWSDEDTLSAALEESVTHFGRELMTSE